MKVLLFSISLLVVSPVIAADFYDPMRPPAFALNKMKQLKNKNKAPVVEKKTAVKKEEPWELNSILLSSQRQHAIINKKLVRKGDVIRGARLVELNSDSVRLIAKGKVIDLKLPGRSQSIKKSLTEKKL